MEEHIRILDQDDQKYLVAMLGETFPTPLVVYKKDYPEFVRNYLERVQNTTQEQRDNEPVCPVYHQRCLERLNLAEKDSSEAMLPS